MTDASALAEAARAALRCLDLTSLADDDGAAAVERLCRRADGPCGAVAAVCVWPHLAALARKGLPSSIAVAAVANFPAGGTDVDAALADVRQIVDAGAQEVDLVLPWRALRDGDEAAAARLLDAVRCASTGLTLKVILETGELRDDALIDRAARLALAQGADFLKTSTGKTPHGATPQAFLLLLRAVAADAQARQRVGVKVSGGVRRVADALPYVALCRDVLGAEALNPRRFRIGASGLLDDIEMLLGGKPVALSGEGY
jgi:deoxyribose-phosphate aldolase